jgi:hypothetical protein
VNELSEETGALFVVAAGNAGPTPYTIGSPGAADAALTVGAVDSTDAVADFSSHGPRVGPHSLGLGLLAASDITLGQDRTVVLDAAKVHRITSRTPRESTPEQSRFQIFRGFGVNSRAASTQWPTYQYDTIWTLPVGNTVTAGEFGLGTPWRMVQPTLTMASGRQVHDDLMVHPGAAPLPEGGQASSTAAMRRELERGRRRPGHCCPDA